MSCHLSASVSLSLPLALSQRVYGSPLSTALSIAVRLPFFLRLPYPQPLPSPLLNVGSEPWRQNEESGSAELLKVSLGHPGLPAHSASPWNSWKPQPAESGWPVKSQRPPAQGGRRGRAESSRGFLKGPLPKAKKALRLGSRCSGGVVVPMASRCRPRAGESLQGEPLGGRRG